MIGIAMVHSTVCPKESGLVGDYQLGSYFTKYQQYLGKKKLSICEHIAEREHIGD